MENMKLKPGLSSEIKSKFEYLDKYFERKLLYHAADVWDQLQLALIDQEKLRELKPMLHYENYYREVYKDVECLPGVIDKIIELSDKEQVKKYDALVDEFNGDLERIKEEKDFKRLQYFFEQIIKIIEENKIKL